MNGNTHHAIREAIRMRIKAGEWPLGGRMPGEVEFAEELACSRTTVNRALRALAAEGIIERKRKGGTRVRALPVPQAQLTIPVLREQVEASGRRYAHRLLARKRRRAPAAVLERMHLDHNPPLMWLEALHLADGRPFALERRWVNLVAVPQFAQADLAQMSANEWLVRSVPFSTGRVALSATCADAGQAALLEGHAGDPLFTLQRTTWLDDEPVTTMALYYPASYSLDFTI